MEHGQVLPGRAGLSGRNIGHRGNVWEEDSQWICLEASLCAVVQLGGWSPQLTGVVCLQEGAAGGCLPERKDV